MDNSRTREELIASFKNRAMIYKSVYDELSKDYGEDKAKELLERAIYHRGTEVGQKFMEFGPSDLKGLKEAFLAGIPDEGRMFDPEVERADDEALDIKFHRCPLKEAWLEAGLPELQVAKLCKIAAIVDNGTFEVAGFQFHAETWEPGQEGCCHLHIRPGATV